jgi:hypothetical protein
MSDCLRHLKDPDAGLPRLTLIASTPGGAAIMAHVRPTTFLHALPGLADHLPWYPDNLLLQIQHTLRDLADLEHRQDLARANLGIAVDAGRERKRLERDFEQHCAAEREPLVRTLAALEDRFMDPVARG